MLYMHINYESHEQKAVRKKYITLNAHVFVNRANGWQAGRQAEGNHRNKIIGVRYVTVIPSGTG